MSHPRSLNKIVLSPESASSDFDMETMVREIVSNAQTVYVPAVKPVKPAVSYLEQLEESVRTEKMQRVQPGQRQPETSPMRPVAGLYRMEHRFVLTSIADFIRRHHRECGYISATIWLHPHDLFLYKCEVCSFNEQSDRDVFYLRMPSGSVHRVPVVANEMMSRGYVWCV